MRKPFDICTIVPYSIPIAFKQIIRGEAPAIPDIAVSSQYEKPDIRNLYSGIYASADTYSIQMINCKSYSFLKLGLN